MSLPQIPNVRASRSAGYDINSENPFRLPSDDQIFRMREEERKEKEEARRLNSTLKIWEKKKSDSSTSTSQKLKDILGEEFLAKANEISKKYDKSKTNQDLNKTFSVTAHKEKENTADFVLKKREMFLVQMSLNTKREEIRKLEEKAALKEEALYRSEQRLEEDAIKFDTFLKENDKKAHDAIKRAEEETKKKQEKIQEIKRLTQQIQAISSEISKHNENLEDCIRYKNFLDMLTPSEFFQQYNEKKLLKREEKKKKIFEAKLKEYEKKKKQLIEQHKKEMESKKDNKKKINSRNQNNAEEDEESKLVLPPPPKYEEEDTYLPPDFDLEDDSDDDIPMYFQHPQQLMEIFSALEEQNLFLIQNSQETEHTLEELQHQFNETKINMDLQTANLENQINELKNLINIETARMNSLLEKNLNDNSSAGATGNLSSTNKDKNNSLVKNNKDKNNSSTSAISSINNHIEKEKLLNDLNAKVRQVYELCGFDASSKPQTLFMLSQMEIKLEVLLHDISNMPTEYIIKAEKEKEKKRRERKREEQQKEQIRLQEERNRRAIERSMQAPKKRVGRQVMYRSKPLRTEEIKNREDDFDKDNFDELKYLS